MKKTVNAALLSALLAFGASGSTAALADDAKTGFTRSEIEDIVKDYLLRNPEILLQVQVALQTKQEEAQRQAARDAISLNAEELFHAADDAVIGNPEGDVTVVEFFDYNCGFCRRALADMDNLVSKDKNLRFVLKEFPILSEDSHKAHVVAIAVNLIAPEKYAEFHRKLLGSNERATEDSAIKVATSLGVDEKELRKAMQDPRVDQKLRSNYQLAEQLQLSGTPGYVIGNEIVPGAMGEEFLREKIAAVRQ
ncbi:DsbA family protein [Chelativorans composti]|jgi:Protein-disulfide isomerase|uniref:DsbA family protein n=1 Tax=Chelativorans composti TaxID=768533 RepID=A0ABW5DGC0_9HYPH